jgi:hypothetical protein
MVETGPAQPASAPADISDQPAVAVRQVWRYAVQIITQIGSTGKCNLQFGRRLLTRDLAGACTLQVDLANDGERSLTPQIWAEVFDADGHNLGRFPGAAGNANPVRGTVRDQAYRLEAEGHTGRSALRALCPPAKFSGGNSHVLAPQKPAFPAEGRLLFHRGPLS